MPASGKAYVTRFLVAKTFLDRYRVQEAGGKDHRECKVTFFLMSAAATVSWNVERVTARAIKA